MITAWKRFINKSNGGNEVLSSSSAGVNGVPPGIQKLDKEIQRKFARGVNYNMKVVIKGDARVGKTALFFRLKGYGFVDDYVPTENLNVTSINWNYKATDDVVKIDLWEAIDSATKKINFVDLKLENGVQSASSNGNLVPAANTKTVVTTTTATNINSNSSDCCKQMPESAKQALAELSEYIDVYKGTDAVLFVMDMTKLWTFKYIQAELPRVPKHVPILIIANHRDQGHHRTISPEQVTAFIDSLERSPCDGTIMYTEASMKNGWNLNFIEKFFSIPFLKLQEASFLKQLELNRCEYMATLEELHLMQESTNKEYEQYLELETIRRRQHADAMSPVNSGIRQLDETTREQIRNTNVSSNNCIDRNVKSIESNNNSERSDAQVMASQNFVNDRLPSIVIGAKCPLPETKTINMTRPQQSQEQMANNTLMEDDTATGGDASDDSDDEEPRANPLVANYQSDLDSDDQMPSAKDSQSK